MLSVGSTNIVSLSKVVKNYYDKGAISPIFYDDYLRKALAPEMKKVKLKEPKIIKIPKDMDSLLKRDFEPAREIKITEYPVIDNIPFWTGDSTKGVTIQIGYENGDSRFPCSIEFSDKLIHGILAGATGMGKSVALDAVIYGIMTKYAPWEVCLTLADAKIVSFKTLADKGFPHIQSIAATEDVDYLISVLEYKYDEMKKMNSVLTNSGTGAKNIEELREFTGLCFPQNIIIVDEFQAMFKGAGKKASKLQALLDGFGRLGRNTGYHILLTSQELSSDVKPIMGNIKIRMALGCSASVSEQILSNDAARTLKQKGRLIMNTEPFEANNKEFNVEYRVPWLDPKRSAVLLNKVIPALGKQFGFSYNLNFYDDYDIVFEKKYPDYIRQFPRDNNTVYLGEPCYYCDEANKIYKIKLKGKSLENFIILNHVESNQVRFAKMLKENFLMHKGITHFVFYNDEDVYNAMGLKELGGMQEEMRSADLPLYKLVIKDISQKRIMCDVDSKVFTNQINSEESDSIFQSVLKTNPKLNSSANRSRVFYIIQELQKPENSATFGLNGLSGDKLKNALINASYVILMKYAKYGFLEKQITRKTMPIQYNWMIGINKMLGIGRDTKTKFQEELKKACQDSSLYNVRFILITDTASDMNFLKECARYVIMSETKSKDLRNVGAEEAFPKEISNVLGVVYDRDLDECFKFKKMFLEGEVVA